MTRKAQSITLSLQERDKEELQAIARDLGITWGNKPNISKLIEAIARRKLQIAPNHDWSLGRIKTLNTARKILIDAGKLDEAREIGLILRDRSELPIPLRAEIESFLDCSLPAWREKIDNFIERQQPFRLSYRDAADRFWNYIVLHGQIMPIEKRLYLVCRCKEEDTSFGKIPSNQDVKGLRHNWTLRLDRITEAAVVSIDQKWKKDLETISVEFELSGSLAFAYERKPEDIEVGELEGDPPKRRIVRNIFSTFWFFREIAQYWEDCKILSPQIVVNLYQEKIERMSCNYFRK